MGACAQCKIFSPGARSFLHCIKVRNKNDVALHKGERQ